MNSFDARVRFTRMVIEQSFIGLLQKKPVTKITVTELCEKAQINRATFYKHYQDIPQLLEKMEEDLFEQLREAFQDKELQLERFLIDMMVLTKKEAGKYLAMGSDHGDPNLMAKTFMICYESAYPLLEQNSGPLNEMEQEMLYYYLAHGSGGILSAWIKGGMKDEPETVAQFILKLCSLTVDSITEVKRRTSEI